MRIWDKTSGLLVQTGALPWRYGQDDCFEVLLVTGRRSTKWLIPKGWPMFGKSLAAAAAQEAFEEAGVQGTVDPEPIGSFRHPKQHVLIGEFDVQIFVHTLRVEKEYLDWPEAEERSRMWFRLPDAGKHVSSKSLRKLILELQSFLAERGSR
jgi:8-oxo-dGTP pyrophosphatase MutT (NUDIX family)